MNLYCQPQLVADVDVEPAHHRRSCPLRPASMARASTISPTYAPKWNGCDNAAALPRLGSSPTTNAPPPASRLRRVEVGTD